MKITERHVQAMWYDAAIRPNNLYTRRGSEVRVVSPGEWNLSEGPDFKNAVLEIGKARERYVGDVEVHLCPSDWDLHGHGADPNYRNVIAHVTWGCGPDPKSLPSKAITIWLGRFMSSDTTFSPEDISHPVRLTAFRLFGRDHNPAAFYATNGLLIQGLLQIHRDYCSKYHPECKGIKRAVKLHIAKAI